MGKKNTAQDRTGRRVMEKTGQRAWESLMLKPFEEESCSLRVSLKKWEVKGCRSPARL
jgi:hypothetical protein